MKRSVWGSLAGIVLAVALSTSATAQTVTLKLAHIYTPGNIWHGVAVDYAKRVETRSGGRIKIEIAHSGTTGDWPQSIEGLQTGTNDIVLQSIGTLNRYNAIAGIEAYPYLIRDINHFKAVYYGPMGRELFDEISKKTGFRIIGAGYRGARHLSSNKLVEKLDDLRSFKLRVPPLKVYQLTWEYLGASPVPMGVAELFTSLQQGVVDGQENPLEVIEDQKFDEVQKYIIETAHVLGSMTFIFSEARFRGLPDEFRKILTEEGEAAMLAGTDRMVAMEAQYRKNLEVKGLTFIPVNRAAFQAKLTPMSKDFPELAGWVAKIQGAK